MKHGVYLILALIVLCTGCNKKASQSATQTLVQYIDTLEVDQLTQEQIAAKLDSVFALTTTFATSQQKMSLLYSLSSKAQQGQLTSKFLDFEKHIQNQSLLLQDSLYLSSSYWRLAYHYEGQNKLDSAYTYYDKAATIYAHLDQKQNLAYMTLYKSAILFQEGLYDEAENFGIKALNAVTPADDYSNFEINVAIANALDLNKQSQEAITYYTKALEIIEKIDPNSPIATPRHYYTAKASVYNNIGFSYNAIKDFKKAEQYLLIAEQLIAPYSPNNELEPLITNNLGHTYLHLKEYKKSKAYLERGFALRKKNPNSIAVVHSHNRLGEYYLATQDTIKSLEHFRASLGVAEKSNSFTSILTALKHLSLADKANSVHFSRLYYQYSDSLQHARLNSRNKFARIEYETLQIQQKNERLFITNSRLIIGIFVSICIVVLLLFLFHFIERNRKLRYAQIHQNDRETIYKLLLKQENHKQEVVLSERERIGRELHDGIINSLFTVRLLVGENDEVTKTHVIKEIEKVQQQIRMITHDLQNKEFISAGYLQLLRNLVKSNNHGPTTFKLVCPESFDWSLFDYEVKMNLYRIIQESIQNVITHAKASECIITIFETQHHYKLTVQDNGIGCNFTSKEVGIGLKNFEDRAREINAIFTISSNKNGTLLQITLPKAAHFTSVFNAT